MAALVGLPLALALGIAIFSPLGKEAALEYGLRAGLIAAVIGGFATSLAGGVPILVSGPRAAGALVLTDLVAKMVEIRPAIDHKEVALLVAACVALSGVLQMLMAKFKFDRLVSSLPKQIVSGFTAVIGVIIVLDQIHPMLHGELKKRPDLPALFQVLMQAEVLSTLLSGAVLALWALLTYKKTFKLAPANSWQKIASTISVFIALVTGFLLSLLFSKCAAQWDLQATKTLAFAFEGRNPIQGSWLPIYLSAQAKAMTLIDGLSIILVPGVLLAVINSIDSLTTASTVERRSAGCFNPNRELHGQGLGNLLSAVAGGVALAATPARTEVSYAMFGRTRLAGIFAALATALMVGYQWTLISQLALPLMAALVASMGINMVISNRLAIRAKVRATEPEALRLQTWYERIIIGMLFLALMPSFSLLEVLSAGLIAYLVVWLYQTSDKLVFRTYGGMHRHSLEQRSLENRERLAQYAECVKVIELEGDLFFVNAIKMREALLQYYPNPIDKSTQHYLVLDFSRVHEIDLTSTMSLARAVQELQSIAKIKVFLSYVKENKDLCSQLRLVNTLEDASTLKMVSEDFWMDDTETALEAIEDEILATDANEAKNSVAWPDILKLADITPDDKALFEDRYLQRFTKAKDFDFYKPGDKADCLYLLGSGDIRLLLEPPGIGPNPIKDQDPRKTRPKRLAALNPGAVFGVDALLESTAKRQTLAKAFTPCSGWKLYVKDLSEAEASHPMIIQALYRLVAVEVSERLSSVARELVLVDA